jgi:hypothetical protein
MAIRVRPEELRVGVVLRQHDTLLPYLDAGCRRFNIVPEAESMEAALAGVGAVKRLLAQA